MEKVIERFQIIHKALKALKQAIDDYNNLQRKEYLIYIRNSKIQSFKFCVDTLWKFLKLYFKKTAGVDVLPGPKHVFRYCLQAGITSEDETKHLLDIVDDRNLSSHTYHEELAEELNNKIESHYELMKKIVDSIGKKLIIK
jgi:nucleotidyltransferase substrate binding protein (TIGR01987 family)